MTLIFLYYLYVSRQLGNSPHLSVERPAEAARRPGALGALADACGEINGQTKGAVSMAGRMWFFRYDQKYPEMVFSWDFTWSIEPTMVIQWDLTNGDDDIRWLGMNQWYANKSCSPWLIRCTDFLYDDGYCQEPVSKLPELICMRCHVLNVQRSLILQRLIINIWICFNIFL